MAHKDSKFERGMTTAQKEKFESEDEKNDATLANDIKGKKKKKKKAPAKKPKKK
jgi:hypothetical protein